ncbi:MAG: diaminopimelate epimerase [Roseiarcus sp.]|jgi:diaminopimelate epimerase
MTGENKISAPAAALTRRPAAKMNGAGNEIVVLDLRGADVALTADQVRAIHRTKGLAFDQLMALSDPRRAGTDAYVRIYNNDGGEAGACGNGTRCVSYWLMRGGTRRVLRLETAAGVLECRRESEFSFRVDMGEPRLAWSEIPLRRAVSDTTSVTLPTAGADLGAASVVNMGNPHAIFWVRDPDAYDLAAIGPRLEHDPMFPDRANISLAHVAARDHIRLRVWERGVGLTRACGSAACAALVAAVRKGLTDRKALVTLPGGDLTIEWRQSDNHVLMTGPVELESETVIDL